ncbi:MAG: polysaccharide pyruvyl transferase family protein [Streptococcaceae bacterium]|jgi:hypothetical protein|nr:polysaccharide pyruvyl transferase family protein [Streptococcaceae bacterium]
MTKKVGILSMHRIYNYGSFLQGYSLKKMIEATDADVAVEFLDYRPGQVLVKETADSSSKLKRILDKLKAYNAVDAKLSDKIRFFNHKRTYGKRFFPMLGLSPEPNYNTAVDVEVIGSDEVFNAVQANTNVGYSRDLFGHDSQAKKVITYAGSFGNTTYKKIEDFGIQADLVADFSQMAAISVRDANSKAIITALTGETPEVNVDPVLAYDLMTLETKIPKERLYKGQYLIAYGYSGRLTHEENEVVKAYAKKHDLKVLCFGGVQECCDLFIDCTPFELLAYFRDAAAVVTDTFHGTIFSIINQVPFATLIRKSTGLKYGNEEKLGYLLEMFDLSGQRVDEAAQIDQVLGNMINWAEVTVRLDEERLKSANYLDNHITS